MNAERNSLAEILFDRFNSRDAEGLGPLLARDAKHTAPGTQFGADLEGREALVAYFRDTVFPKFTAIEFIPDNIWRVPETNVEIVEWHGNFTTSHGTDFQSRGVFVLEHDGDQIVWMREYFDTEKTKNAFTQPAGQ